MASCQRSKRKTLAEGLARHIRHRIPEPAAAVPRIVDGQNVRVLQAGGDANFLEEAGRAQGRSQLGMEKLQRDRAIVLEIVREVDHSHPTPPKLALDSVTIGEGDRQVSERLDHGPASDGGCPTLAPRGGVRQRLRTDGCSRRGPATSRGCHLPAHRRFGRRGWLSDRRMLAPGCSN